LKIDAPGKIPGEGFKRCRSPLIKLGEKVAAEIDSLTSDRR